MGATKRYFREQFQTNKFGFEHDDLSDFYLASWQSGHSPWPLLCIRLFLFLGCVAILAAALAISESLPHWPIYLTSWGVVLITATSGCAVLVSFMATINGSIDSEKLPWYVKLYWALYCMTMTVAFLITVFYYVLLYPPTRFDEEFEWNEVLDVFVHGINSVVMFCLLATARHPIHLLHFLYPFLVGVIYLGFSIIYYVAGGTNRQGEHYIYPVLDWSDPGPTTGLTVAVAGFVLILHLFVVGLSALRDFLTRRYCTRNIMITYT